MYPYTAINTIFLLSVIGWRETYRNDTKMQAIMMSPIIIDERHATTSACKEK